MRESFDDVEINAACPKCGQGHQKTVRWLREEGSFDCFMCGTRISIEDAPIRSALRNIEQVREELNRMQEQGV
jgi:Zn ribbon nucleic-acid-binding protein